MSSLMRTRDALTVRGHWMALPFIAEALFLLFACFRGQIRGDGVGYYSDLPGNGCGPPRNRWAHRSMHF